MNEPMTTLIGTVVSDPVVRVTAGGEQVLNFRIANNSYRMNQDSGGWEDTGTLFASVSCWRRLVKGVAGSVAKGDAVIAYGQLRASTYVTKEGIERTGLELRAAAVGPDLARCTVTVDRRRPISAPGEAEDTDPRANHGVEAATAEPEDDR